MKLYDSSSFKKNKKNSLKNEFLSQFFLRNEILIERIWCPPSNSEKKNEKVETKNKN